MVDLRSNGCNGAVVASAAASSANNATATNITANNNINGDTNARAAARLLNGHGGNGGGVANGGQMLEGCAKCDCGQKNRLCVCVALSV